MPDTGSCASSPLWSINYPMVVFDQEGTISEANPAFEECFSAPGGELAGTNVVQLLFPNDRSKFAEWLTALHQSGGEERSTVEVEKDGRHYRADIFSIHGGDSRSRLATVLIDITREKQIEQQKADFTSMIVHDLRGPLTAIMGSMEMVVSDWDKGLKASYRDLLASGVEEAVRMNGLINELLDTAKIESGSFTINKGRLNVAPLVRRAVTSMQNIADREGILLETVIDGQLPALKGDKDKLTQVLINLLSNAIKFTPRGGLVCVFAERTGEGGSEAVRITVTDTGSGIDRASMEKLFSRYSQADNQQAAEEKQMGGTGLGLYIVKELVEAHGGRIRMASEKGRGTSVSFTLPRSA